MQSPKISIGVVILALVVFEISSLKPTYRLCVPERTLQACEQIIASQSADDSDLQCIAGRDRMDCLEKVNRREADFLAVDPEDMYVAFNLNNEDFTLFSEVRTKEEPEAEYRYEGIMLVHKNSNINSIADLKGKKSCHTGFGRNVGYKIPITKLRKYGVLHTNPSVDNDVSTVENELKGLSELFQKSCLVGNYSPNLVLNEVLKKRYANLCELCEDPIKCNYPDKYSGYEGAIKCLVENGGDVAFTKVSFVRRYFGLPLTNGSSPGTAQANRDEYEYFCEDGSRRPVTGKPCSWAQRPWSGYLANGDIRAHISSLQERVREFYAMGQMSHNILDANQLGIYDKSVVVDRKVDITPGDHLEKAQYKDVIEREGYKEQHIIICVASEVEMRKCQVLENAAYSRDIRPKFSCLLSSNCISSVEKGIGDAVIVTASAHSIAKQHNLKPTLVESGFDHYLVVIDKGMSHELQQKISISFDPKDIRSRDAALKFNYIRGNTKCSALTEDPSEIRVVKASELSKNASEDKHELICVDQSKQPISLQNKDNCYFDATPPTAIYVQSGLFFDRLDTSAHTFISLATKFGPESPLSDVFKLFGVFEPGQSNVLFSDDATDLIPVNSNNITTTIDVDGYARIQCRN